MNKKIRIFRILFRSFADFFRDNGPMLAAAVSFFFILALVPYCLLLLTILGHILGERQDFYVFFTERIVQMFPEVTKGISEGLATLITYKKIGNITMLLYAFLCYELLSSLEHSMDRIFKTKHSRHFLVSLLLSILIVTFTFALVLVSFISTYAVAEINMLKRFFPNFEISIFTSFVVRYILPFLVILLTILSLYLILPNQRINLRYAFIGAVFSTIFLEVAKHLFTLYFGNLLKLGAIYGPLTAFVILLLWIYYSVCILLIGGEIVHNLQASKRTR
ncbi:MAG: YihY/virulence factor BrkB family protein [Thermodesulfovibrionales bacterium]